MHGFVFLVGRDVVGGFVLEAVGFEDIFARPFVAAVVVVEVEEGAGVEEFDVMFLYGILSAIAVQIYGKGECLPAICLVAQSASGATTICSWPLPPCALA